MESWSNKCAWLLYSQFIPRAFTLMFHYLNKSTFDFVSWAWRIFFQCVSSWRRLTNQRADGRVLQMKVSDTWAVNRLVLIHLLKILCSCTLPHSPKCFPTVLISCQYKCRKAAVWLQRCCVWVTRSLPAHKIGGTYTIWWCNHVEL